MWLLVLSLLHISESKFIKTTHDIKLEDPWVYLTKFGMDIGMGPYEMRARLTKGKKDYSANKHYSLQFLLYLDEDWTEDFAYLSCEEKVRRAKRIKPLELPTDGSWTGKIEGVLHQTVRPHVWYFAVADCQNKLKINSKLRVEMTIKNEGDSHLPVELKGLKNIYLVLGVAFLIALGANIWKVIQYFRSESLAQTNMLWVNFAVLFQFLSIVCYFFHLSLYESNGKGAGSIEFIGQAFGLLSQLTISCIFILISEGWTIDYSDFPNPDLYVPIMVIVGFLHIVISGFGKATDDAYYKFSLYEGLPGWGLVLLRLSLLGYFVYNMINLSKSKSGQKKMFLTRFLVSGSLYFLTVPALVMASKLFAPYLREKIIVGGTVLMQGVTLIAISYIFTSKGEYYKASVMSESVLPGKPKSF